MWFNAYTCTYKIGNNFDHPLEIPLMNIISDKFIKKNVIYRYKVL